MTNVDILRRMYRITSPPPSDLAMRIAEAAGRFWEAPRVLSKTKDKDYRDSVKLGYHNCCEYELSVLIDRLLTKGTP